MLPQGIKEINDRTHKETGTSSESSRSVDLHRALSITNAVHSVELVQILDLVCAAACNL